MAKSAKSSTLARSETDGRFVQPKKSGSSIVGRDPKASGALVKTVAGTALTQRPNETNAGSQRVIIEVSNEHREALKRLADR